jgi:hypothetical protein
MNKKVQKGGALSMSDPLIQRSVNEETLGSPYPTTFSLNDVSSPQPEHVNEEKLRKLFGEALTIIKYPTGSPSSAESSGSTSSLSQSLNPDEESSTADQP